MRDGWPGREVAVEQPLRDLEIPDSDRGWNSVAEILPAASLRTSRIDDIGEQSPRSLIVAGVGQDAGHGGLGDQPTPTERLRWKAA